MSTWIPRSVQELEEAITSQAIVETEFCDLKEFPASSTSGNKDIAKDVAAFSVNGGAIIYGAQEDKARGIFSLAPRPLSGWAEKISQVALSRVQPSVRITCEEIANDDGSGYMIVRIPASQRAPHMVDGRYYGRADTTNYQLSDLDVRTLIRRNSDRREGIADLLRVEVSRDIAPEAATARLMALAQPVSADDTLLLDAAPGRDLSHWVRSLMTRPALSKAAPYSPSLDHASSPHRRAGGMALSSYFVTAGRQVSPEAKVQRDLSSLVDLEIREDGGLRLFYGRASDARGEDSQQFLLVTAIVGVLSRLIEISRYVISDAEFHGAWQFGVALVDIRGLESWRYAQSMFGPGRHSYSENMYGSTCEADQSELDAAGSPVLGRLVGRLLRAVHDGQVELDQLDEFAVLADGT